MIAPVYNINLDLEAEYKTMVDDLIKFSTIFFVTIFLYCSIHPTANKTVERNIIEIYSLIILGIVSYHLVVNLIVRFS